MRRTREHTITQSEGLSSLAPAEVEPSKASSAHIYVSGKYRVIQANGIPDHLTGRFPSRGNPHRIQSQSFDFKVTASPKKRDSPVPLERSAFGIAVNGVPFDPGAAEWYLGQRSSPWRYEALSGAIHLGVDANHAHVQRGGIYHYHVIPTLLVESMDISDTKHSPIIGWAADGFPIYALSGYADGSNPDSGIKKLKSSYRLKSVKRPDGPEDPGGTYDGTFVADYEYIPGHGDLDECNGMDTITPDFPKGTYAYFLTEDWPVIPRYFRGKPSRDFSKR
ncbi:MAG: YHYH protein [Verrucomicrobiota bacterium]